MDSVSGWYGTATGSSTSFDVVVDAVSGGIGSYDVTVSLANATVASITNASAAVGAPNASTSIGAAGANASLSTSGVDGVDNGSNVSIASVTVAGDAAGSTALALSVPPGGLATEDGTGYTVTATRNATLTVTNASAGPPPLRGPRDPTDLDGDGAYEDVNGDGIFAIVSIQFLFVNRGSDAVVQNPNGFDFDGHGRFTIADVQALFLSG